MKKGIVDIHCHILPGIDDGSQSMPETMRMLETAQNEGITHIIATPHYKAGHHNAAPEDVADLMAEVQQNMIAGNLHISLYQGNEVFYYREIPEKLEENKISGMNGKERILVEFFPMERFAYIRDALDNLLSEGLTPILAHVERYGCLVKDMQKVYELRAMGVEIQANASDIVGEAGFRIKRFLHKLLKNEWIDYIGTDAHRAKGRAPYIKACAERLYRKYGAEYADAVLFENAMERILKLKWEEENNSEQ